MIVSYEKSDHEIANCQIYARCRELRTPVAHLPARFLQIRGDMYDNIQTSQAGRWPGELWLRSVLDVAPTAVLVEIDERIAYVNQRYITLLGYRRAAELIGRPVSDIVASADVERLVAFGRSRAEGRPAPPTYDFLARRRDGTEVRVQAAVSVATVGSLQCITTFVQEFEGAPSLETSDEIGGSHLRLSKREREVMDALLAGARIKEIGVTLRLSEKTVATHRARLLKKMGLGSNRELFQYALRHRLIDWS